MDTPKSQVSWLESFPPDIWAYFASYIPGEQLGRLMMTGCMSLWRRLLSPGVVKSINLGKDFMVFKSMPKFLNALPSLEYLSIYSCGDNWSRELGFMIGSVPSRVRKLELRGKWGLLSVDAPGERGTILKLNVHLPHLEHLDIRGLKVTNSTWMAYSPQSLTTLIIFRWDGTVELPSSLIHFEAKYVTLDTSSFVSKLPPSLESFVVKLNVYNIHLLLPLLPASTNQLNLGLRFDGRSSWQNFFELLPKSLTCFLVPSLIDFVANPELTALFPATLTNLSIWPDFPSEAWPLLPQHLRSFKAQNSQIGTRTEDQVVSIPFHSLPRSITSLELKYGGPLATSNSLSFPPQLTCLKIPNIQLSPESAKLLPACLNHLEIRTLCKEACAFLPQGLTTLIVSSRTAVTPNLINALPRSLTFLDFDGGCISWVCNSQKHSGFDFEGSHLPPTLIYLRLPPVKELGDPFIVQQKLPNLLELDLGSTIECSYLSVPRYSPHLQTLHLGSSQIIGGECFEDLPRFLTHLNLYSSESIFDSDIRHLPPTLEVAFLSHAVLLTDLCIPDLPRHLKMLNLEYNELITPSSFPHFPSSLRSSQLFHSVILLTWHIDRGAIVIEN